MDFLKILIPALSAQADSTVSVQELSRAACTIIDSSFEQQMSKEEQARVKGVKQELVAELLKRSDRGRVVESDQIGLIKAMVAKAIFKNPIELNDLPPVFNDLKSPLFGSVFYIKVPEQTNGWTCGYWGEYNADAQEELRQEDAISHKAITERARNLYAQLPAHVEAVARQYDQEEDKPKVQEKPSIDNLVKLAVHLGKGLAESLHFITYLKKDSFSFSLEDPSVLRALGLERMEDVTEAHLYNDVATRRIIAEHFIRRYEQSRRLNFLCFLYEPDLHWILGSVIELPGRKPVLDVLDSYNFDVTEGSDSERLLLFLHDTFLVPIRKKV